MNNIFYKFFIATFMFLIIFPNYTLTHEEENAFIVEKENRKISVFPQCSILSKEFYKDLEKWYQDRISIREFAIRKWTILNFKLGVMIDEDIFCGVKDKFLFSKSSCINKSLDINEKIENLKKIQNFTYSCNKKFIFISPPNKETIYCDYFPAIEKWRALKFKSIDKKYCELLTLNSINYIPLYKKIKSERKKQKELLYFSDDHHLSYYASSCIADLLLKKIQTDLNINFYNGMIFNQTINNAYKERSYANKLGLPILDRINAPWNSNFTENITIKSSNSNKNLDHELIISNNALWEIITSGEAVIENKDVKNNITLLLMGDSYSSYIVPYLSQFIKKIIVTHYSNKWNKEHVIFLKNLFDIYNPDIFILEIYNTEFYKNESLNIFKNINL